MPKKTFVILLSILLFTFGFTLAIKYYKPASAPVRNLDTFPLELGEWTGQMDQIDQSTIDMLTPDELFSATYVNASGHKVHLFFDYFSAENSARGVHSPRNCLPGSGWIIVHTVDRIIEINNRTIPASRFYLRLGESRQVMDFWYITRNGDTSNDYIFKLFRMLSSLTLRPTDAAFIRFVGDDNPDGLKALAEFEKTFIPYVIDYLPFE